MVFEHTRNMHLLLLKISNETLAYEGNSIKFVHKKGTDEKFLEPPLDKILNVPMEKILEVLEFGVLKKVFEKRVKVSKFCPKCFSTELVPTTHCPACGSTNILKGMIIGHHSCNYWNLESMFSTPQGLICPRCGDQLYVEGKDFSRKLMYKCNMCGNLFDSPLIDYHCQKCGKVASLAEVGEIVVDEYRIGDSKLKVVEQVLNTLKYYENLFKSKGYKVYTLTKLAGLSGIEYDVDLYAVHENLNDSVLIQTYLLDDEITPYEVIRLYTIAYDVGVKKVYAIASQRFTKEAEELANVYNIERISPENVPS